ncbi:hypothetical protein [Dysgonomonas sp. 511]|uniref:hypothetical protein n=1 Tax=Dysgonomonas sp. 511 TaxID=2302930 RepID=UPI0013D65F8E|nr:hypothetical protein [Dysgonomonas sp. 511]NDV80285.1 hypothetical protein [Dysgonomonas sp. 511]
MKTRLIIKALAAFFVTIFLPSCGGNLQNEDGFIINKENDWTKLNLKGKVKELRERGEARNGSRSVSYIKFNKNGYIIEKGFIYAKNNNIKEIMKYDDNNNMMEHTIYEYSGDPYNYDVLKYDSIGNLIEKQYYRKNYQKQIAQLDRIEKYCYEIIDKRKVNVYLNDVLSATIEYDKYKNEIFKEAYNSDGSLSRRYKNEYTYNDKGNILEKKEYNVSLPPFTMEEPVKFEYSFTYDERDNLIRKVTIKHLDLMGYKEENKRIATRTYETKQEWLYDTNDNIIYNGTYHYSYKYDFMGNWVLKTNALTYEPLFSREYTYYDNDTNQKAEMSISIDEVEVCDGSSFTLFINGGVPFDDAKALFKVRCYHKKFNIEQEIYLNDFVKKSESIYEVEVTQNGGYDEEYMLEVQDANGNKKNVSFTSVFCN